MFCSFHWLTMYLHSSGPRQAISGPFPVLHFGSVWIISFTYKHHCAKSLESCPTLSNPIDASPPGSPHSWNSQGKNTGVGCYFLLQCVKVKSLSRVGLLATPWTAAYQAPPSMGFSRQKYWSGVPLLSLTSITRSCDFI